MTDAELTILSLLSQGSRYGHELQQIIDERSMRDWLAIGYSSIFYMLNKFERQQMVSSELRPNETGAPRKLYTLTEAGYGVLRTAVSDLLRAPRSIGSGFELGLVNLHVLKPAQVYQMLSYHRADLEAQLEAVRATWAEHQQSTSLSGRHDLRALYSHSIKIMEADLQWLNEFLADWLERYPGVEQADLPLEQDNRDEHRAQTHTHSVTPPNPLKILQRLQRLPKSDQEPDVDASGGNNA